jgi:signal transduction histidine kinase/HAMP domain-containing protein/ActR/RegA family two-component response regulator
MQAIADDVAHHALDRAELLRALRAFKRGDFSVRLPLDLGGIDGEIALAFNDAVELNAKLAAEVARVAAQVGKEGRINQRVRLPEASGAWADGIDSVNTLIGDMVFPVTEVARVIGSVAKGDLSQTMVLEVDGRPLQGEVLRIGQVVNTMVGQLNAFASEVSRVAREVGTEGKLGGQARVPGVAGVWKDLTDNVNSMAANLTSQVRNIAEVTTAVAKGDLSKKITVDVKGEILELKSTINTMVDQLNAFASEVSRVAREVGTEGKLGGQARVSGVAGVWKDLTDNVNSMAANLTSQVRGIVQVVTAVARGDLKRKVVFEAKGEIAALADTINEMIDTLATFGDQVTNVAREVGIEGKLGGQARVPGAAGLWRDLTDNVNQLAANLTTQVRAIAEVATAVTKGDLTRSIMVQAQGEVAALKDNINEMIRNLADTTRKNTEQDWLKTHLARFTRMLQGHRELVGVARLILSELAPLINAHQAAFYIASEAGADATLELLAAYAQPHGRRLPRTVALGDGLIGECARERKRILLKKVPGTFLRIGSALGTGVPANVVILPVLFEGELKAVIELASLGEFSDIHLAFLDQLTDSIGVVLHTIAANMRTEALLQQSQSLTAELQAQQQVLQRTNERLEQQALNLQQSEALLKSKQEELRAANEQLQEKARQLSEQMRQVELKNREVEQAKAALEEKAEQLALSSRYKSEFLANMSHELRTPLNSLLILARLLVENADGNLTPKQVEFAQTILSSGTDLLSLINDILDLAKIESGTVTLNVAPERLSELCDYVDRAFRQLARDKGLEFGIVVDASLPPVIETDGKRLQQILKNLLSNAIKFTEKGGVMLRIAPAAGGWTAGHAQLDLADLVLALSVTDTGIGIPANKQRAIFEAFQQVDGTTSREYGGTGLGLSISRELARLLGGEIGVASEVGRGSTFTLYLPASRSPVADARDGAARATVAAGARDASGRPSVAAASTVALAPVAAKGLAGKKVLLVDDDIRNVFALTSALERYGMQVVHAGDGKHGIDTLKRATDVDCVLMDVMMPGLDGYDTIRIMRQIDKYRALPIVALTAKAMVGDREKCLEAGATDYIAKPADLEHLLAMLVRYLGDAAQPRAP